jgi:hypothetical protein
MGNVGPFVTTLFMRSLYHGFLAALVGLLIAGCASTPKIDWQSQVGSATYDSVVKELGPPDKESRLTDGTLISEWISASRSGGVSFGIGTGISRGPVGVGVGHSVGSGRPLKVTQMTFSSEGTLQQVRDLRR